MAEPRFSLIVATRGRDADLGALLDSLRAQGRDDLEVIVVDQNADDRLVPILARFADRLPVTHLRSDRAHANRARNLGLAEAQGAIVAFPDDDCLLPPGVLDCVDAAFAADPTLAVLTGPAASPAGGLGSGRWRTEGGPITLANLWTSVIEFNLFLRRDVARALGGFDERMGPGTDWGSAEGNDLVARAIRAGHRARYDPALRIVHPDKRLTPVAVERARVYGAGLGVALRRHAPGIGVWLPFFVRPLGGMMLAALRRDRLGVAYYLATLRGRLAGFRTREARP
ncbi:glycosyltransferase family 2 protein [Elioraea sp.]|uniref:glycosyltransferase family 2 protein n=1 Tax=Elioraea sp. TaxID=2185103 RepID=UPI0021DE3FE0|nr:glycosyltransferase family A protein [Elioraea sp.]GIX10484.1 MAG: glycosyl transferase [Elioraea sp.]